MKNNTLKRNNFILLMIILSLLAYAYFYMEKTLYLTPCPLCYAQRLVLVLMAVFFILLLFTNPFSYLHKLWTSFVVLSGIGGSALSIRHLYIQNLPKGEVPDCGLDFYGMAANFPFSELLYTMLTGSGDCAEVQWEFLYLSIPGWTLIAFLVIVIATLINNVNCFKKQDNNL